MKLWENTQKQIITIIDRIKELHEETGKLDEIIRIIGRVITIFYYERNIEYK